MADGYTSNYNWYIGYKGLNPWWIEWEVLWTLLDAKIKEIDDRSSPYVIFPKYATDPDTTAWGTDQKGRNWFNTTDNKFKGWNGTEIVLLG